MSNEKLNDFIVNLRIEYENARFEYDGDTERLEEKYAIVYAACAAMLNVERGDVNWHEFVMEALQEIIYQKGGW